MQPEEAQDKHHDHNEADQINDAVHGSGTSANNPDSDCMCSNSMAERPVLYQVPDPQHAIVRNCTNHFSFGSKTPD